MYHGSAQPEAKYIHLMKVRAIADDESMDSTFKMYELNKLRWKCMAQYGFYSPTFREIDQTITAAITRLPEATQQATRSLYGIL